MIKFNIKKEAIENSTDSAIKRFEELYGPIQLWTPKKIRSVNNNFRTVNILNLETIPDEMFFNC